MPRNKSKRSLPRIYVLFLVALIILIPLLLFTISKLSNSENIDNSKESKFVNSALVTKSEKLQLINILTGERKSFVEGEFVNSNYLYHYNGVFSPDKNWVLFKKDQNLWRANADGTEIIQLSTQGKPRSGTYLGVEINNIKWSPDGQQIFYVVEINRIGNGAMNQLKTPQGIQEGLWVMDSDGTNQKYIPQVKKPIEWMPDNKNIVFVEGTEYTSPTKSYDITTDEIKTLLPNTAIKNLSWSENGDKGLYADKNYGDTYLVDGNMQQIDFLRRENSTLYQDKNARLIQEAITISPDGKYIIITELTRPYDGNNTTDLDANLNVYLWDTDTSEKTKLPISVSLHTKPFWSKDGQKIVYLKQYPEIQQDNGNVYLSLTGDLYYYDLIKKRQVQVTNAKDINPFNVEF